MHVVTAPPAVRGVNTLQHVGNPDGLGAVDLSGIAGKVGWAGVGVWAYAKWVKKDAGLQKQALPFAIGGFIASFIL